ncbi:MAG TPA: transposase [Anaerolineae bacterium]|nr:transposase [Anaerolineae bacterium]
MLVYIIPQLDVNSRYKLIGYSREKSWTNGLCWYLWVISCLRAHGVNCKIVFTVDHGEEFGGKSWMKIKELRKLISGFGCKLIQNHKGHCEENAHVERSHRTDDDEFYRLRVQMFNSEFDLILEASGYIYYYNNLREHSSLSYKTPIEHLKQEMPNFDDGLQFIQPIMLDNAAVLLGPWSGYNLLAQHLVHLAPPIPWSNNRTIPAQVSCSFSKIISVQLIFLTPFAVIIFCHFPFSSCFFS